MLACAGRCGLQELLLHRPAQQHKRGSAPEASDARAALWELALWQDSMLIVAYSNFFSTARCGLLRRGGARQKNSYAVWAPEAIWHYNVQRRSATDGADQLRKNSASLNAVSSESETKAYPSCSTLRSQMPPSCGLSCSPPTHRGGRWTQSSTRCALA